MLRTMKISKTLIKIITILLMSNILTFSQEFNISRNQIKNTELPTSSVNMKIEQTESKNESEVGFCAVNQAAAHLLRIANSNTMGLKDEGVIEYYEKKKREKCGPVLYVPQQIKNPGTPNLVCYRLSDVCAEYSKKEICAVENEYDKLYRAKKEMIKERERVLKIHMKIMRERAMMIAEKIIEDKITEQLAEKPLEQIRLSWEDMYKMRGTLNYMLGFKVNAAIDAVGETIFSHMGSFGPIMALSGPVGYITLSALPVVNETFQCNISIKNMIIHGVLKAGTKLVFKVPVVDRFSSSSLAHKVLTSATVNEANIWIKYLFGDGLVKVEEVKSIKYHGKEFAKVTVRVIFNQAIRQ